MGSSKPRAFLAAQLIDRQDRSRKWQADRCRENKEWRLVGNGQEEVLSVRMNHRVRCSGYPGPIGWSRRGRLGPGGVLPGLGEGEALGGRAWHKHFFHGALGAVTRLRWVPGVWEVGRQGSGCRTFVLEVWQHEGRGNQATRLLS